MHLTFLGATRTVTGSSYLITVGNRRVMVDCGLYQGLPELQERNYTHPAVKWSEVDAILLTHAHIDHCGLIPRAVRLGHKGPIYSHQATIDLAEIMLFDSAEIHEQDAEWLSRKRMRAGKTPVEPLYTRKDVALATRLFKPVKYNAPFEIFPGIKVEYHDAGHILGAASIAVDAVENDLKRRIVFSGDVGNHQVPILREPDGFEQADAVLIETTYGNRLHESPGDRYVKLGNVIREAHRNSAKVLIPAFTVGRTQELLYIIGEMMEKGEIPPIRVFLDSPMAIAATDVYVKHSECFDTDTLARIKRGEDPFSFPSLKMSRTIADSRRINSHRGSAVIIAGGGMCEGGRIVHHLKHNLFHPENHLVFVGFQAEGTLGRVILNGQKSLKLFGEEIAVKAKITAIGAFSAHADKKGLLDWLGGYKKAPEMVFTVHGEEKVSEEFGNTVREELGYQTYLPKLNQDVDLSDFGQAALGHRQFVQRTAPSPSDINDLVARVGALGEEFKSQVGDYITDLEKRVRTYGEDKNLPNWQENEVRDVLKHMCDSVEHDIDCLKNIAERPKPGN